MARIPIPIQEAVRDFLADLLGRGVAVDKCDPMPLDLALAPDLAADPAPRVGVDGVEATDIDESPETFGPQTLAVFSTDAGVPVAAAVCDLRLGAATGAALTLVPAVMLDDVARSGELPDNLAENLHEVLNIFSSLLNSSSTPHLVLTETVTLPTELSPELSALLTAPERRRDFIVALEGYGEGHLAVLAAPTAQ
jgi:hypothetical protein